MRRDGPRCLAVLADLHANLQALEAVLADADRRGIREVWCAGDVVGYGGSPAETVALLRRRRIPAVAGNLDRKLFRVARRPERGPVPLGHLTHLWTRERLDPGARRWLRALPFSRRFRRGGRTILLVHGSPASEEEYLRPGIGRERLRVLARMARASVVVAGHSHAFWEGRAGGTWFVNAGSVGRLEGRPGRAGYAILDLWLDPPRVRFLEVPYDLRGAVRAILRGGLPREYARMLETGLGLSEVVRKDPPAGTSRRPCSPGSGSAAGPSGRETGSFRDGVQRI